MMNKRNLFSLKIIMFLICSVFILNSSQINSEITQAQQPYSFKIVESSPTEQSTASQLLTKYVPAPSLANNFLGDSTEQPIAIYLPPSYNSSNKRYPVVYFLPGFGDETNSYLNGDYQGFKLREVMDKLISNKISREMIVVIVNGRNVLGGSFYVNSPVTGNWEDFAVKDVVTYIDSHYRTIANSRSRGISGHSMGGFGALIIAMRHPDIFCCVYALSPGLFDQNGLSGMLRSFNQNTINRYLSIEDSLTVIPVKEAQAEFFAILNELYRDKDWEEFFNLAYGAAFSPYPGKNAPYINYPYRRINDSLVINDTAWKAWESGFGNLVEKIKLYKANLSKLHSITIEYGSNDEYSWLSQGCFYFSELLSKAGISHELLTFKGGHQDKLGQRLEEYMLPSFSRNLVFK